MDNLHRYSVPNFRHDHGPVSVCPNPNLVNGFKVNHESTNPVIASRSELSIDSSKELVVVDLNDCNQPVLKYISDILLEEDLEGKPCMLQDCLALQAAEKSFYDVLVQKDTPFPKQPVGWVNQSSEISKEDIPSSFGSSNRSFPVKTDWVWDLAFSPVQSSVFESFSNTLLVSDSNSKMQNLGNVGEVVEASKFLSKEKPETVDLERFQLMPRGSVSSESEADGYSYANGQRGRIVIFQTRRGPTSSPLL